MAGLLFLLIAFGLSIGGSLILWWRNRDPTSVDFGISEFQREMRALSPNDDRQRST